MHFRHGNAGHECITLSLKRKGLMWSFLSLSLRKCALLTLVYLYVCCEHQSPIVVHEKKSVTSLLVAFLFKWNQSIGTAM